MERAHELELAALRERHLGLGLVAGLDLLVDALRRDRERVRRLALVLQLELDLLAGLALEDRRVEVVVVELDLDLAGLAGDVLRPVAVDLRPVDGRRCRALARALAAAPALATATGRGEGEEERSDDQQSPESRHRVVPTREAHERFSRLPRP